MDKITQQRCISVVVGGLSLFGVLGSNVDVAGAFGVSGQVSAVTQAVTQTEDIVEDVVEDILDDPIAVLTENSGSGGGSKTNNNGLPHRGSGR